MLDQENLIGKSSEVLPTEQILRGYGVMLREGLRKIGLPNIVVVDKVEYKDIHAWRNDLTLAIAGLHRDAVGLFVSSEDAVGRRGLKRWNIRTVLSLPVNVNGSLLMGESGGLYADTFFVCEDGVVKPIVPTSPLPIDGLIQNYLSQVPNGSFRQTIENAPIGNLSNDKQATRNVLAKYGIPVPKGVLLDPQQETWEQLKAFLTTTRPNGYVIKPNHSSGGAHVRMFDTSDYQSMPSALAHAEFLMSHGIPVILEERKQSISFNKLKERTNGRDNHCVRSIILVGDLGSWSTVFVDHEIRYRPNDNMPVNVSRGAGVTAFAPGESLNHLMYISELVGKALFDFAQKHGVTTPQIVGLDIIYAQVSKGNTAPFVIEFNAGSVGGFGTLCELNECPIETVRKVFLPALTNFLENNHRRREDETSLTRIPHTSRSLELLNKAHQCAVGVA